MLWKRRLNLRDKYRRALQLEYSFTNKQWLHNLAPIALIKLWNQKINAGMDTDGSIYQFKIKSKDFILMQCRDAVEAKG